MLVPVTQFRSTLSKEVCFQATVLTGRVRDCCVRWFSWTPGGSRRGWAVIKSFQCLLETDCVYTIIRPRILALRRQSKINVFLWFSSEIDPPPLEPHRATSSGCSLAFQRPWLTGCWPTKLKTKITLHIIYMRKRSIKVKYC